jgi:hypothetical protein
MFLFEVGSGFIDIQSKSIGFEMAKVMAQQLVIHANARFQDLLTGDESWMACNYMLSRMLTMARSDVDPIVRPIKYPQKTMTMIVFGINGIALIDILPEKAKLSSEYSRENIIKEPDLIVYPARRKSQAICIYLHFDNALFLE